MHVTQIELEFVELPGIPDEKPLFVPKPDLPIQHAYLLSMWDSSCKLAIWDAEIKEFRDAYGVFNHLAIRSWATLPQPIDWPAWGDVVAQASRDKAVSSEWSNPGWLEPHYKHIEDVGHKEVSLQDVLNGRDGMYVNLAPMNRLSGPERAAFLKLSIAAERPTGSVSQPSEHFATYVHYAISEDLTKASPAPRDVMRERLWAAAQHDVFTNTGAIASMLDAGGLARVDYAEYQIIIEEGLAPLIDAGY